MVLGIDVSHWQDDKSTPQKINFKKAEKYIFQHHSYKIPCIVGIPIRKVSKKYFRWVKEILKNETPKKKTAQKHS